MYVNWSGHPELYKKKNPIEQGALDAKIVKYPSMSLYSLLYYDFQLTPTNLILSGHGAPI
jgi:hypothetical protein